jgi:glucokinase
VAAAVAEVVAQLDAALGADPAVATPPVGVGAPGMVDRAGRLCFAPNLPQAHGVDWHELVGGRLPGRNVVIENDANFAVLAEHRLGAARSYDDVVMVTLGTGIGGGVVIGGRVQVGSAGFAGEIGHMVVDPNGPPCPCGRRGCWERFASGAGLGLLAREAALAGRLDEVVRLAGGDAESVRGEDVSAAAAAGDPAARQVIEAVGSWIGFGLANLACVLDPSCFVLGGGVVQAGDLLVDTARATFAELVEGGARRPLAAVVPAEFGERSGAVGAALAARLGGLG